MFNQRGIPEGHSHIKRMELLVGNFEKKPKMYQYPVVWLKMFSPLQDTNPKSTH